MDGEKGRDMDEAWLAYLTEREELKKETHLGRAWNPQKVFEAGWKAAQLRSSGWYSGNE
jgi:hypothetical protein